MLSRIVPRKFATAKPEMNSIAVIFGPQPTPMTTIKHILAQVTVSRDLSRDEARWTFEQVVTGKVEPAVLGALLGAMATKGECVDELVGAAQALRAAATPVRCPPHAIDTCGTGGDGVSTFNVSTTAAIIAAAAGAVVAKHGNRSSTRASGSTEVLIELGIDVDADAATVERCLAEVGIGYLNARTLHPAMKHAAPVRQALPMRTIFNLLGPLCNPAGVKRQLLGVPRPELVPMMAEALLTLGVERAWVVHGQGLCDLTVTGESVVSEVRDGAIRAFTVDPESCGLRRAALADLCVSSVKDSAAVVLAVLGGERGPRRDQAVLNAGAALVVADMAHDLRDGIRRAEEAIDSGAAMKTLDRWRATR